MPRMARVKSADSIYHIMVRSIKEIDLFQDNDDKIKYLALVKKYQFKYGFAVYAYCLMNNHGHLIIDCLGADISRIMQVINFCYAQYYNRKYNRYGPVFQDRFKSKVIDSKRYMITLSAYIHNNPKDIPGYENSVEDYPFSSLKEYINKTNTFGVLNPSFLVSLIGLYRKKSRKAYLSLVRISNNKNMEMEIEFVDTKTDYQSNRKIIIREVKVEDIIKYVSDYLGESPDNIYMKRRRSCTKMRSLVCFLMSSFCNMTQKEICETIGNITQSGVSNLTAKGLKIVTEERRIIQDLIA